MGVPLPPVTVQSFYGATLCIPTLYMASRWRLYLGTGSARLLTALTVSLALPPSSPLAPSSSLYLWVCFSFAMFVHLRFLCWFFFFFRFCILHISEIIQYLSFSLWLISLSIIPSMLLQMSRFHTFYGWVIFYWTYTHTPTPHVLYPFTYKWTFKLLPLSWRKVVNNATANVGVHISFQISLLLFFRKILRIGVTRSYGNFGMFLIFQEFLLCFWSAFPCCSVMLSIFSCACWPSACFLWKNVFSCPLPLF